VGAVPWDQSQQAARRFRPTLTPMFRQVSSRTLNGREL
jgi:hypothetical protein